MAKSSRSFALCHTLPATLTSSAYAMYSSAGMRASWSQLRRSSSTWRRCKKSSSLLQASSSSSSAFVSGQVISRWLSPASTPSATPRPSAVSLGATVSASRLMDDSAYRSAYCFFCSVSSCCKACCISMGVSPLFLVSVSVFPQLSVGKAAFRQKDFFFRGAGSGISKVYRSVALMTVVLPQVHTRGRFAS